MDSEAHIGKNVDAALQTQMSFHIWPLQQSSLETNHADCRAGSLLDWTKRFPTVPLLWLPLAWKHLGKPGEIHVVGATRQNVSFLGDPFGLKQIKHKPTTLEIRDS